jgi:hypothetical protein
MRTPGDQERGGGGDGRREDQRNAGDRSAATPGAKRPTHGVPGGRWDDRSHPSGPASPSAPAPPQQGDPVPGGPAPGQPEPASWDGYPYAIRVQGHLDAHWSEWLDGMTITHEEGGTTRLEGSIIDQAALHGLLNKLRDLCVSILAVVRLDAVVTEP